MSLLAHLQTGCLILLAVLLLVAAWRDLQTLQIANSLPLAIAALYATWSALGLTAGTTTIENLGWAVCCALALFLAATLAFALGMMGGGDVKLVATTGLFAGPALMLDFVLVVAVAGGLLGVGVLMGVPLGAAPASGAATARGRLSRRLPYGPAIAAGGLWLVAALT
jgi:prepilin peptidase CpaA